MTPVNTFLLLITILLTGCGIVPNTNKTDSPIELADDIIVSQVISGCWIHTTYFDVKGYGLVDANGLILIDGQTAVMIDLPWTDEQTRCIFNWVEDKFDAKIQTVIPTHSHQDCIGGLNEAHQRGANSIAFKETVRICKQNNMPAPKTGFVDFLRVKAGDTEVELRFLGPGHTIDNIVTWIPKEKLLFAGCLLKGLDSTSIGYVGEADLKNYPVTLNNMAKTFGHAKIVVPGHGDFGGPDLIDHTMKLLKKKVGG